MTKEFCIKFILTLFVFTFTGIAHGGMNLLCKTQDAWGDETRFKIQWAETEDKVLLAGKNQSSESQEPEDRKLTYVARFLGYARVGMLDTFEGRNEYAWEDWLMLDDGANAFKKIRLIKFSAGSVDTIMINLDESGWPMIKYYVGSVQGADTGVCDPVRE